MEDSKIEISEVDQLIMAMESAGYRFEHESKDEVGFWSPELNGNREYLKFSSWSEARDYFSRNH